MPKYVCKIIDNLGKASTLVREAVSEEILLRDLAAKKKYILSIKEEKSSNGREKRVKYSKKTVIEFTDTLSLMLNSGLSLRDSLEIAGTVFIKGDVVKLISVVIERIDKGNSFSEALESMEITFPPVYRGLVRIGERIGNLDMIMKRLSKYLSDEHRFNEKILSSLLYPFIVLGVAAFCIVMIILTVFPKIKEMFLQLGQGIPEKMETAMTKMSLVFIISGIIIVFIFFLFIFVKAARRIGGPFVIKLDSALMKIPGIGPVLIRKETLNFTFAMETLTTGGIAVEEALEEASMAVTNKAFRAGILTIKEKVMKGENLSNAFLEQPLFPERLGKWIGIGERVGHVEKVFSQMRIYYQEEIERFSTRFMGLIEPALILFVGIVILFIVLTFIVPLFSMYGTII